MTPRAEGVVSIGIVSDSAIRRMRLAPPNAPVNLHNVALRGNPDAPVMLVEFADYQCPYCNCYSGVALW